VFIEILFTSAIGSVPPPAIFYYDSLLHQIIGGIRVRQSPSAILAGEIAVVTQISDQESGLNRF
jgi:hypothetical protein